MRSFWDTLVFIVSAVIYVIAAGLLFVLGVEVVNWTFAYLMGTSLAAFLLDHAGPAVIPALLANQRIMALVLLVGLAVYVYFHITEEGR